MNRRHFLKRCGEGLGVGVTLRPLEGEAANSGPKERSIVIDAHSHFGYLGMFGQRRDVSFEESLLLQTKLVSTSFASLPLKPLSSRWKAETRKSIG